jgi:uncharacterized protein YozE (UPF0346 family)
VQGIVQIINQDLVKAICMEFTKWLYSKILRDDRVGDLARDAYDDPNWPKKANDYQVIYDYLESQNACDNALETLKIAWKRYKRFLKQNDLDA